MLSGEWIEIRRIGTGFSAIWRVDWNTENRNGIQCYLESGLEYGE